MTSHPNHLQDSGAPIREPNAPHALASIGEEIALYASYAIILIVPLMFWVAI